MKHPHLIPCSISDFKRIVRHGIKSWFTWETLAQTCELAPLLWWQKLARGIFK